MGYFVEPWMASFSIVLSLSPTRRLLAGIGKCRRRSITIELLGGLSTPLSSPLNRCLYQTDRTSHGHWPRRP
jgi:hypothetical protein